MQENTNAPGAESVDTKGTQTENLESPKGQANENTGDVTGLVKKKDELLGKVKSLSEQLKAERERNEAYQQKELESQGRLNELIDKLRTENELKDRRAEELKANYTYKVLTSEVISKAAAKGMNDPSDALSLFSMDGLKDIVDEEFNVNSESVERMLEGLKKSKPYLFRGNSPQVRDGVPISNPNAATLGAPKKKSLADLSEEEWHAMMIEAVKREKGQ